MREAPTYGSITGCSVGLSEGINWSQSQHFIEDCICIVKVLLCGQSNTAIWTCKHRPNVREGGREGGRV